MNHLLHLPRKSSYFQRPYSEGTSHNVRLCSGKTLVSLKQGVCLSSRPQDGFGSVSPGEPRRGHPWCLAPREWWSSPWHLVSLVLCCPSREVHQNCCADEGDTVSSKREENFRPRLWAALARDSKWNAFARTHLPEARWELFIVPKSYHCVFHGSL